MSSETSTKRPRRAAEAAASADESPALLQPWHVFLVGALIASAAAAVAVRGTRPTNVIFVCLTVLSAGFAAYMVYRTLWPLVHPGAVETPEMLGGRTRAALEREKTLVLRAIKELEFDRAMGKVSESDWHDMTGRLRARALRVIRQLDSGGAAYRELIERELAARQTAAPRAGLAGAAATGARTGAKLLVLMAAMGGLLTAPAARAQMAGAGGMAGMPDAKAMSGIPRPDSSVPTGGVSVRLVRGQISNLVTGSPVEFVVNGKSETIRTDETGHAMAKGLAPGATVHVVATVDGERLDSQDFTVPQEGGVVLMLVATDKSAAERMAKDAVAGAVTIGGQSRIVTQFDEEVLQVYYLLEIVNDAPTPVRTAPLVFDLPRGAVNATVLEGSPPNAVAKGARVTVPGPFAPGATSMQIAYSLAPAGTVSIRQPLPAALGQVAVLVEKVGPTVVSSSQLTTVREGNQAGKSFVLGTGPGLKAGDVLAIDISGLPHQVAWPRNLALALGGLVLFAGAWGALRTGGRSAAVAARQQLEQRREELFGELLRLRAPGRTGEAGTPADSRRRELVAELEKVYGELDTGAALPRGDQGLGV